MLTKWTVENFKSIVNETSVSLAPLTIFTGPNGAGKSVFLQSILLVAQTLPNKRPGTAVILNGELDKIGSFNCVRSSDSQKFPISLGWGYSAPGNGQTAKTLDFYAQFSFVLDIRAPDFDYENSSLKVDKFSVSNCPSIPKVKKQYELTISQNNDVSKKIKNLDLYKYNLDVIDVIDNLLNDTREPLNYDVDITGDISRVLGGPFLVPILIGCSFVNFLPRKLIAIIDPHKEISNLFYLALTNPKIEKSICDNKNFRTILFPNKVIKTLKQKLGQHFKIFSDNIALNAFNLGAYFSVLASLTAERKKEIYDAFSNIKGLKSLIDNIVNDDDALSQTGPPPIFARAQENGELAPFIKEYDIEDGYFASLTNIASINFRYLGPIREKPKAFYQSYKLPYNSNIGINGQLSAVVLFRNRQKYVNYIPSRVFDLKNEPIKSESVTFIEAVRDWLKYLGLAESLSVLENQFRNLEVNVARSLDELERDLTEVGLGVSQVLPVLVMGLIAEKNEFLIFDRPEAHLHPQAQARLADFFLSLIVLGKNCLIETHSERLINHLRVRRIKEETSQIVQDNLKIYYVEKIGGESNFQEVSGGPGSC